MFECSNLNISEGKMPHLLFLRPYNSSDGFSKCHSVTGSTVKLRFTRTGLRTGIREEHDKKREK